jgi:hypothetical protein
MPFSKIAILGASGSLGPDNLAAFLPYLISLVALRKQ